MKRIFGEIDKDVAVYLAFFESDGRPVIEAHIQFRKFDNKVFCKEFSMEEYGDIENEICNILRDIRHTSKK